MFSFTKRDGEWLVIGPVADVAAKVNEDAEGHIDAEYIDIVAVDVTLKSGETKRVTIDPRPAGTFTGKFGALEGVKAGYYFLAA